MHSITLDEHGVFTLARCNQIAAPRPARYAPPSPPTPVTLHFEYRTADPFAVHLLGDDVPWVFDRVILAAAVQIPNGLPFGEGDVRIYSSLDRIFIELTGDNGDVALITCPLTPVQRFLRDIDAAVPPGTEDILTAMDAWLEELETDL